MTNQRIPAKRWISTLNNPSPQEHSKFKDFIKSHAEYGIIGRETGASGTPHLQIYFCLKDKKRLSTLKNMISTRIHLEKARGTCHQNRLYCSKDGDYWEHGQIPKYSSGKSKPLAEAAAEFIDVMDSSSSLREYMNTNPATWLLHGKHFVHNYYQSAEPIDRPHIIVAWITGPTGIGKSHFADNLLPNAYRKAPNHKWWSRYKLEKSCIIDELNHDTIDISYYLTWFDKYKTFVETKGGEMPLHVDRFIVTSNYTPEQVFKLNLPALLRRITVFQIQRREDLEKVSDFFAINTEMRTLSEQNLDELFDSISDTSDTQSLSDVRLD